MKCTLLYWLVALLIPLGAVSQSSFRTIGINQGLSQSSVVDIAFDSIGFAWFATQDGLNRYDGKNFLTLSRTFDDITTPLYSRLGKLFAGQQQTLWMITTGGNLEKMDLRTHTIIPVKNFSASAKPIPALNCIYEDNDHTLWLGTDSQGIYRVDPSGRIQQSESNTSIHQITRDREGNYWALTRKGVIRFHPGANTRKHFLRDISCNAMQNDRAGNYWLGTYGQGLYCMRKNDSLFSPYAALPSNLIVQTLLTDRSGNVWIGTYGNGLFRIDTLGRLNHFMTNKKDPFSLPYNDILCLKEDNYGGIWIGTDGGGVAQYNIRFNNFTTLTKENVPDFMPIEQVRAVCTDRQGGTWIGTSNNGLGYLSKDGATFRSLPIPAFRRETGDYQRIVSLLADLDNDIWVGTQGNGLIILDRGSAHIEGHFSPDETIWCMTPDTGALVWVGTRNGGLYLIHKQKGILQTFDTTAAGQRLPANNIRAITRIDDSILCIGFEEKGIRFLNTHTRRLLPGDTVPGAFTLKCIYYHAPYCWIGTLGKGLGIYDMRNGHIAWINEQHGLPNNTIYGILEDRQHRLWLSTNKGLDLYYPPSDPAATTRSNFYGFGREAGLQSNEFNTGAWHQAADGRLFFGGIAGLTYFHPDKIELGGFQPSVTITGIMANNTPLASDTATPYKKYYELDYTQNNLSFNYAALEFVSNDKIDYSYILRPFDKDTIDVGNRNYVTYTNLPPGHYVFEVVESSPFSEEKLNAAHIDIYIRPPFWKTSWFIIACVLAVVIMLTVLYRYRIRQLLKVQQIRNHIATDLHDDIGSTLTNISLLAELSRKSREKGSDAGPFLDRISEEVQNSSQALDDIVWSINTNNDSIGQILARMRRYASEIFDGANTRYEFQADINSSRKKIPMDQRRDFFLVFKESINNIYKHADASQIHIHVSMRAGLLTLRIEDNGKGFDTQAVTHRNGLKNIRFRVEKWKGRVDIRAVQGGGTTIFIEFPLR